ncbi:hypothetical protein MNBD_GAMMA15-1296 [hydrothermal vent metagenome]|uniref:Uncharacterized protein n=1 Tax=hydrothermal vent metagenome TaxID=652676 RepID=A0A3B0YD51_9ZZZZ
MNRNYVGLSEIKTEVPGSLEEHPNAADQLRRSSSGGYCNVYPFVAYDANAFPSPSGASMELKLSAYDGNANDLGSNWAIATTPWGTGDLGTSGSSVPACWVWPAWLFVRRVKGC